MNDTTKLTMWLFAGSIVAMLFAHVLTLIGLQHPNVSETGLVASNMISSFGAFNGLLLMTLFKLGGLSLLAAYSLNAKPTYEPSNRDAYGIFIVLLFAVVLFVISVLDAANNVYVVWRVMT